MWPLKYTVHDLEVQGPNPLQPSEQGYAEYVSHLADSKNKR